MVERRNIFKFNLYNSDEIVGLWCSENRIKNPFEEYKMYDETRGSQRNGPRLNFLASNLLLVDNVTDKNIYLNVYKSDLVKNLFRKWGLTIVVSFVRTTTPSIRHALCYSVYYTNAPKFFVSVTIVGL